jgi:hypothetical protein
MRSEAEIAVDDGAAERFQRSIERDDAAAREADNTDVLGVNSRMGGKQPQRRQRAGDVGGRRCRRPAIAGIGRSRFPGCRGR